MVISSDGHATARRAHRPPRHRKPTLAVTAFIAAGSLLIAGCSSSASKKGGSGGNSGASAAAADPGVLAAGSKPAATSNPVVIGVLYTDDNPIGIAPEIKDAGAAAESYVNSHGGVGGRPVKVIACNGKNNAQSDAQCAAKFVNGGAVTVYGLDGFWGGVGVSVIGKAGIANQTLPISGPEFSAPNSYPWQGSGVTASAAAASYVAENKFKGACIYADIPSFKEQCDDEFQATAKDLGATTQSLAVPAAANDLSQYATKLSRTKSDAVLVVAGGALPVNLIKSSAQISYKPQWILPSQRPDFFTSIGSLANGIIFYNDLVDANDQSNADAAVFQAAMAKWAPDAAQDAFSIMTFANIVTLARLGAQVGGDKITRAGLPGLLANVKDLPQFMGPALDASKHLPNLPHALHTGAYLYKYNDAKLSQAGKGYYVVPGSTG
jgi:ABC-type branched-subunit amino acid transport system substrate-binding protein